MTIRHPFRFVLELRQEDGAPLGQVPVVCDWEPALESARFRALRQFRLKVIGPEAAAEIRPAWHEQLGPPYAAAVEVALTVPGAGPIVCRVPTTYFQALAREASLAFVQKGLLRRGEPFIFLVTAYGNPPLLAESGPRARFSVEEVPTPLSVQTSALAGFYAQAMACGWSDDQDIPVFIPQHVLDEADDLTRQAGALETASVLIGHLHRDEANSEVFLEVTAQIPARETLATSTKVSFGPATWDAASGAIALRGKNERMAGWLHSHPARHWCNPQCLPEARARCPFQSSVFFSADDCAVQRTVFSKAYHVALLVTHTDAGLQHALFGWRNGVIVQRAFHILGAHTKPQPAAAPTAVATIGETDYEANCAD